MKTSIILLNCILGSCSLCLAQEPKKEPMEVKPQSSLVRLINDDSSIDSTKERQKKPDANIEDDAHFDPDDDGFSPDFNEDSAN